MTTLAFSGVDANVTHAAPEKCQSPQEQSARPLIINLHVYDPAPLNAEPAMPAWGCTFHACAERGEHLLGDNP